MMSNNSQTTQSYEVKKRMCDRDRLQLLYGRANEIGASLEPRIQMDQFNEDGSLACDVILTYNCEHWQSMDTRKTLFLVPAELAELQETLAKDRQTHQQIVREIPVYPGDSASITELMHTKHDTLAPFLEALAHAAGGKIKVGATEVTYYRFSRLPRRSVCEQRLLRKTYNTKGSQFYFLLPVDYALLRDFLAKDTELYAALPESEKHSARWEASWKRKQALRAEYILRDERLPREY